MLSVFLATLTASTTLILVSLGGISSERSGVVNIALEGMLLFGAFGATLGSFYGGPVLGILFGVLFGLALSLIHAAACVRFKVNHIVSGLAINLLAFGLCRFLLKSVFGSSSNSARVPGLPRITFGMDGGYEFPVFFLVAVAAVLLFHFFLFHTPMGLRLSACGENPKAAESLGISVNRLKFMGVALSGVLCGLAGAYLALDNHQFTDGMSGGRGFIAIAAYIAGAWKPWRSFVVCLLFGLAQSIEIFFQTVGVNIPVEFIQIFPYLFCIVMVACLARGTRAPQALGQV